MAKLRIKCKCKAKRFSLLLKFCKRGRQIAEPGHFTEEMIPFAAYLPKIKNQLILSKKIRIKVSDYNKMLFIKAVSSLLLKKSSSRPTGFNVNTVAFFTGYKHDINIY